MRLITMKSCAYREPESRFRRPCSCSATPESLDDGIPFRAPRLCSRARSSNRTWRFPFSSHCWLTRYFLTSLEHHYALTKKNCRSILQADSRLLVLRCVLLSSLAFLPRTLLSSAFWAVASICSKLDCWSIHFFGEEDVFLLSPFAWHC